MKSGNGSSSSNEDVLMYQPFAQFLPAESRCKSNSLRHLYETAAHRPDVRIHTHTHIYRQDVTSWRGWRGVEMVLYRQQVGRSGAGFSDGMLSSYCEIIKLRVWSRYKDCLLMTCRRTITPSSYITP
jgi:hypothetical protein